MDYLKQYNISDKQIDELKEIMKQTETINNFRYNKEDIKEILDIFQKLGVRDIYQIIKTNPYLFYDTKESIQERIDEYPNKKALSFLLNMDAENLKLINMLY